MEKNARLFGSRVGQTAEWVKEMHAHYVEKGYFRGADLHRVLGDPRKSASLPDTDAAPKQLAAAKLHR